MSGTNQGTDTTPSDAGQPADADEHTDRGTPTDGAHRDAGDGSLTGSTPAGLTVDELLEQAEGGKTDDGGAG